MSDRSLPAMTVFCEERFAEHGDTYLGMGWTKSQANTDRRYDVMLGLVDRRTGPVTLLDFGCGTGHFLEHLRSRHVDDVQYTGLDVSELFVSVARDKFPEVEFHLGDLLAGEVELGQFDYIVMNGLFTYKGEQSFDEMAAYWQRLLAVVMQHARMGVAFNVTSPYVDWTRDDLFHVPVQMLADVVSASECPNLRIRHDYELFETTVYAFRHPVDPPRVPTVSATAEALVAGTGTRHEGVTGAELSVGELDLLADPDSLPPCDVVLLTGVPTAQQAMGEAAFLDQLGATLSTVRPHVAVGLAFRLGRTDVVGAEGELRGPSLGAVTDLVTSTFGRRFVVRQDYGVDECTVEVYV